MLIESGASENDTEKRRKLQQSDLWEIGENKVTGCVQAILVDCEIGKARLYLGASRWS